MTFLRQLLAFALLACSAGAAFGTGAVSAHYSFMDVYRLAVSGGAADDPLGFGPAPLPLQFPSAQAPAQFPDYQVRVASIGAQPALPAFSVAPEFTSAGFAYSTSAVSAPSRWLLILSGLALAAWVARRRLGYSL